MGTALTNLALALLLATAPLLLVARFFWPKLVNWWMVLGITAAMSWICIEVEEQLRDRVRTEAVAKCQAERVNGPVPDVYCLGGFHHRAWSPGYLKWLPGVRWLAMLLPAYGLAHLLRLYLRRRATKATRSSAT